MIDSSSTHPEFMGMRYGNFSNRVSLPSPKSLIYMVGRVGIEPTTRGLRVLATINIYQSLKSFCSHKQFSLYGRFTLVFKYVMGMEL